MLTIDTGMFGQPETTAVYLHAGRLTVLIDTGPRSTVERVLDGLAAASVESVDWIVLTHVHLDHAGAAGTLARRFPGARFAVHRRGARHLASPERLWESVSTVYGRAAAEELWGGVDPVPEDRIRPVDDGDRLELGDLVLRAVATPGHAPHHHALLDEGSGVAYVGDALGVRLPDAGTYDAATPPPDFQYETALRSVERVRGLGAASLWLSHFGPADAGTAPLDVDAACDAAADALRRWREWTLAALRDGGAGGAEAAVVEGVMRRARAALPPSMDEGTRRRVETATSYRVNVAGILADLRRADR
jgi:glyoxylase-like metal-dependent hydrolase (beta-lactamase superfamily II)